MAKESMKAREVKRAKTVEKYAEKRKALKEAGDYEGLQKLPRNASPRNIRGIQRIVINIFVRLQYVGIVPQKCLLENKVKIEDFD